MIQFGYYFSDVFFHQPPIFSIIHFQGDEISIGIFRKFTYVHPQFGGGSPI